MENINRERVLIVGVDLGRKEDIDIKVTLAELRELVYAADGEVIEEVLQNRHKIDATYYIGKGKAQEISLYCDELNIDTVVFDNQLSGAQIKNLENIIQRKIIDRTNLILDIFAKRATSKEGKLQVELAQLKYTLPRLIGLGKTLSRTGAGIGTRGPGEKKLETDRRHILSRITDIKHQLKELENVREMKRKQRIKSEIPLVALVGYTNAGKSTIFNELIKSHDEYDDEKSVFAHDMLFATLDTTLRKCKFQGGKNYLLIDTVGFVSKLPTGLVEAFKGTLEEVIYADLIVHVIDVTSKDYDLQKETTLKVLKQIGVTDKPILTVYNKVDDLEEINTSYSKDNVYISALEGINIDIMRELMEEKLFGSYHKVKLVIPFNKGDISSYLYNNVNILESSHNENGTEFIVELDDKDYNRFKQYIVVD
ncbi:GTPase HflX [Clostridiaceae bacterium M8S5]|nr:GTPase HflX [Clostridiaceae bacterium M8S5]